MNVRESPHVRWHLHDRTGGVAGKGMYSYKLPKVHPMRGRKIRHTTTFALGLLFGAFIALLFNIVGMRFDMLLLHRHVRSTPILYTGSLAVIQLTMASTYVGIRLFRGFFIVFLHVIFMGINVYG